jgi:L-threonate 2-dehydrogenase
MRRFYAMSANDVSLKSERVGVIGLGIMGGAFARHLAEAGVQACGYDVIAGNVEAPAAHGMRGCGNSREVAEHSDIVITSLPSGAALEDALFGEQGLLAAGRSGLLVIETSTLSLADKEQARSRLQIAGIDMLDAPISGTGPQARAKDIAIFASGDRASFERAQTVLGVLARSVRFVGPFGAGTKLKLIANLLVAVHIAGAAEAIVLGEKAGLDPAILVEILADSAATSRMLEVRGPSMASGDCVTPMMKAQVFLKDLDLIANLVKQAQCATPLFSSASCLFIAVAAQGMGQQDTGAVISILRQMAGLRV